MCKSFCRSSLESSNQDNHLQISTSPRKHLLWSRHAWLRTIKDTFEDYYSTSSEESYWVVRAISKDSKVTYYITSSDLSSYCTSLLFSYLTNLLWLKLLFLICKFDWICTVCTNLGYSNLVYKHKGSVLINVFKRLGFLKHKLQSKVSLWNLFL